MKYKMLFYISCVLLVFSAGLMTHVFWAKKNPQAELHTETSIESLSQHAENVLEDDSDVLIESKDADFPINALRSSDEETNIKVYGLRNKAVVNVSTEILAYNWFFEPTLQEGGIGSGSIIDVRGYILTNYHVVQDATKVFVTLYDSTREQGEVIGYDLENDLAIIKIDPKNKKLETIPFGDSSKLQVGQKVLAIGNPFAFDRTLTTGIISGLGRPIRNSKNIIIQNMIQTDASINPGNSGGPLLNAKGELIGVNTLIYSPSRGSVGVGFSVPSHTVTRIVKDIIKYGKVQRGWISMQVQPLFAELVQYAKLPVEKGLLVFSVDENKNASREGIRGSSKKNAIRYGRTVIYLGGDIITKINNVEVDSVASLLKALENTRPKDTVNIEYYRGKKKYTSSIILDERPKNLKF